MLSTFTDFVDPSGRENGGGRAVVLHTDALPSGKLFRLDLFLEKMPFPLAGRDKFREALWARGEHELSPESERNDKYGW